uniref:Fibrinogen C-terminal domain-containing protein n=1 Tax=Anopheles farauti TaxID=69004 RepID=A0A182QZX8_9DIPT
MFESTTANELANLRNYITDHSSRMNTSMVHLSESGKKLSKHLEQRMEELTARSGVYTVKYNTSWSAFQVYRDGPQYHGYGGNWTVFLRRINGSVNFNRTWREYEIGFGDLNGEHWLGLEKLHQILLSERHELLVEEESSRRTSHTKTVIRVEKFRYPS